jgi:Zn-dependent protease with chaperone function
MAKHVVPCPACGRSVPFAPSQAGRRLTCPACGATARAPIEEAEEYDEDDAPPPKRSARRSAKASHNPFRVPLLLLMGMYFPFLAGVCLVGLSLGGWLIWWGLGQVNHQDGSRSVMGAPSLAIGGLLILTVLHVLWGLRALFHKNDDKDDLEFELPHQWQEGLAELVEEVAAERGLPAPDLIRVHAADVASVYDDRKGRTVLRVGGLAVAALPKRTLAGIIAHELGHCGGGDTALSRLAARWHGVMGQIEAGFWGRGWHRFNPLTWVVRAYHWLYAALWFANMRRQEYAADAHEVDHVGKEKAAATLVLISVLHTMDGVGLGDVAEAFIETNDRIDKLFAEQVRRVRTAGPSDWEKALRKAMRPTTGWFDTHPCLKERLGALRVSPKKALKLAMDLSGEPATALFANWPVVEKFLTKKILDIVREYYVARREMEETVMALRRWEESQGAGQGE